MAVLEIITAQYSPKYYSSYYLIIEPLSFHYSGLLYFYTDSLTFSIIKFSISISNNLSFYITYKSSTCSASKMWQDLNISYYKPLYYTFKCSLSKKLKYA